MERTASWVAAALRWISPNLPPMEFGDLAIELARDLDDVVARGTGPGEMDEERRAEHAQHDEEGQRRAQRHAPARNGRRRRSLRMMGATGRRLSYRSR